MKIEALLSVLLLFSVSVIGCQKEVESPTEETAEVLKTTDYIEVIGRMGFMTNDIEEFDDYYIVGGGTFIDKKYIDEYAESHPSTKACGTVLPSAEYHHLYLNTQYVEEYRDLLDEAVKAWNELENCNLRLSTASEHSGWPNVTVEISQNPKRLTTSSKMIRERYGAGYLPEVSINTSHRIWQFLDNDTRKKAIMHGLGHMFGLLDCESNKWIASTYRVDGIMRNAEGITEIEKDYYWPNDGFGDYDKADMFTLYPLQIDGMELEVRSSAGAVMAGKPLDGNTEYTITAKVQSWKAVTDPRYTIEVTHLTNSSASAEVVSKKADQWKVTFDSVGSYKVKVTLYGNNKELYTCEDVYDIDINVDEKIYPSTVNIGTEYTIGWDYTEHGITSDIDFSVSEKVFGEDVTDNDIKITRISKYRAKIKVNNYGYYVIKMTRKGTNESCYLHVSKFYRDVKCTFNDPLLLDGLFQGRYPEPDVPKSDFGEIVDTLPYTMHWGVEYMPERFCAYLCENYVCNECTVETMDMISHWGITVDSQLMIINAGEELVDQALPPLNIYRKGGRTAYGQRTVTARGGYYTTSFPKDKVFLSETDAIEL